MTSQKAQNTDPARAAANAPNMTITTLNAQLLRILQTGVAGDVKFAAEFLAGTVELFAGFVVIVVAGFVLF